MPPPPGQVGFAVVDGEFPNGVEETLRIVYNDCFPRKARVQIAVDNVKDQNGRVFQLPGSKWEFTTGEGECESEFRVTGIDIQNTDGQPVEPENCIYTVKVGEEIKITVHFTNPYEHEIGVTWTTRHGRVPPAIHETTNTYTAPSQPGVDHVTIEVWDRETGESLAPVSLSITVVPE